MYSALVLTNNYITNITLEQYLRKKGLLNIYQSSSLDNAMTYLNAEIPRYLFVDIDSVSVSEQVLNHLMLLNQELQIVIIGDQTAPDFSSFDASVFLQKPFGYQELDLVINELETRSFYQIA